LSLFKSESKRMKLAIFSSTLALCASNVSAFAPQPRVGAMQPATAVPQTSALFMSDDQSLEDEVEALVEEEVQKNKRMSNLRNEKGVEYAPWMRMSKDDEDRVRAVMRDKAEARRRRREEQTDVQGELLRDFGFQELSGTGLKGKVVDGNNVELEWATGEESNTKGFLIKRRAAKTEDFEVVASYQNYGPLESKGPEGGIYRFYDEDIAPGSYVYRVTECGTGGAENDLSQCLVDVQTVEEQRGSVIAAVGIGAILFAVVAAGALLDPIQ
jgi:hypothetical protein